MASLAKLIRWRDELFEARLSGVRTLVDQSGERIEYKSDSEMAAAIRAADAAIAVHRRKPANKIIFQTSKGL